MITKQNNKQPVLFHCPSHSNQATGTSFAHDVLCIHTMAYGNQLLQEIAKLLPNPRVMAAIGSINVVDVDILPYLIQKSRIIPVEIAEPLE